MPVHLLQHTAGILGQKQIWLHGSFQKVILAQCQACVGFIVQSSGSAVEGPVKDLRIPIWHQFHQLQDNI